VLKDVGVTVPSIGYTTSSVTKLPLTQMKINFSVKCDYPRFKRLLRAFETDKRWIAVQSISIGRDADPGSVTVQLELVTYFAEPGAAAGQASEASAERAASRRAG